MFVGYVWCLLAFRLGGEDFDGDDCGIVLDLLKDFGWIRSRERLGGEDFDGDDCGIVLDLLKDFGWI